MAIHEWDERDVAEWQWRQGLRTLLELVGEVVQDHERAMMAEHRERSIAHAAGRPLPPRTVPRVQRRGHRRVAA